MTRPVAFYGETSKTPAGLARRATTVVGPYASGSAGDREPGHLVGVAAGDRGSASVVADPPRLAGRGGPACIAAGWVTWLPFVSRTKFFYYALEFEPFVIICIVLCVGLILGPARRIRPTQA